MVQAKNLKFKNPIRPTCLLRTDHKVRQVSDEEIEVSSQIVDAETSVVYASGRHVFKKIGTPALVKPDMFTDSEKIVSGEDVKEFLPHGNDILFLDQVNLIDFSDAVLKKKNAGLGHEVDFSDIAGTRVISRLEVTDDFYYSDKWWDPESRWVPSSFHAEMPAQSGIFMIWGIRPRDKGINVFLLGFSAEYLNPMPTGITVENDMTLMQSKGDNIKGSMNFFEAEIRSGDIVYTRMKYSAMCTYSNPS